MFRKLGGLPIRPPGCYRELVNPECIYDFSFTVWALFTTVLRLRLTWVGPAPSNVGGKMVSSCRTWGTPQKDSDGHTAPSDSSTTSSSTVYFLSIPLHWLTKVWPSYVEDMDASLRLERQCSYLWSATLGLQIIWLKWLFEIRGPSLREVPENKRCVHNL